MTNTSLLHGRVACGSHPLSVLRSLLLAAIGVLVLIGCTFGGGAEKPKITQQPQDLSVFRAQSARFTVGVEGKAPLAFQWLRDGAPIAGAIDVTYSTPGVTDADDGAKFSVVVTNDKGTATSAEGTLSVLPPPTITTQPTDQTVNVGATATFTVVGDGTGLQYQWYRNDLAIAASNVATYTTPATVAGDDGSVFSVDVINGSGRVTSNNARLNVLGSIAYVTPPLSQSINVGETAIFGVAATGGNLTYQWRRNATDIGGATSAVYATPPVTVGDDGATYDVVVTNAAGTATSAAATLTVVSLANAAPPVLPAQLFATKSPNAAVSVTTVLNSDGSISSWGDNSLGQAGNGTTAVGSETPRTATLPAGRHAIAVAAGAAHFLALLDDGSVYAWGQNSSGQLGLGDATARTTPVAVTLPHPAVAVAAGIAHSVVVLDDGTVYAWGTNILGELGSGSRDVSASATPTQVPGISNAVAVAAGNDHNLVLLADGTVLAWGANAAGQLGNGDIILSRTPVPTGLTSIARIRAGGDSSMAVSNHRIAYAWGENSDSQMGLGTATTTDVRTPTGVFVDAVDVAASNRLLLIVQSDGHVAGSGANETGSLGDTTTTARTVFTPATGLQNILTVASGGKSFSLALQSDGSVFSWGDNTAKQLGNTALAAAGTATPTLVPGFDAIP